MTVSFFLSHSLIQEWETKPEGCHSLATSSEWQPTNFVCHSLARCFLLFVANPDVAWPQLKVQQLTLMLTVVNDNLSTCHFRAPVLTFRKCCLCPSKLGAPDGGGHESLPFVQTHNYPGDREIKTTPCCGITHARNLVHLGQGLEKYQLSLSNTCRLVFLFCGAFWDQVVLMGDRIRRGCEELEG